MVTDYVYSRSGWSAVAPSRRRQRAVQSQREFAGDPNVVGRSITLDGHPHTIVGILSPSFRLNHEVIPTVAGIDKPEIFMPPADEARNPSNYGSENYNILARLKPGVTMRQAQSDIDVIAARIREEKHRDRSFTISVVPLMEQVVGDIRPAVLIIFGAVSLVLLIACTNVANLLLSRASARQPEIAIRAALGAGRVRLIRQFLTESILLSLMGGLAGLGIAGLCVSILGISRILFGKMTPPGHAHSGGRGNGDR
jgi:putative ABC transport system permease protein